MSPFNVDPGWYQSYWLTAKSRRGAPSVASELVVRCAIVLALLVVSAQF